MRYRATRNGLPVDTYVVRWRDIDQISPALRYAVVCAEDKQFFQHYGFSWRGIKRAIRSLWRHRRIVSGGSTLSQQLARNLYLTASRTFARKVREAAITVQLERHLSKKRILELYLNVIEWGDGVWGCDSASEYYFGKDSSEIDVPEAAFLASRITMPLRALSPVALRHLWHRQVYILTSMYLSDFLPEKDCIEACLRLMDFPSAFEPDAPSGPVICAPALSIGSPRPERARAASAIEEHLRSETAARQIRLSSRLPRGGNRS